MHLMNAKTKMDLIPGILFARLVKEAGDSTKGREPES